MMCEHSRFGQDKRVIIELTKCGQRIVETKSFLTKDNVTVAKLSFLYDK